MIGKIDKYGNLWIKRGDEYAETDCVDRRKGVSCSHECSHFGEPEKDCTEWMDSEGVHHNMVKLELCHRTLYFRYFEDKR